MLQAGSAFPQFSLLGQDGKYHNLSDYAGKWLVVYFYPKDNTSGCSLEAQDFAALFHGFAVNQANIVGVSPDSVKSHCNFADKYNLPFSLLSDPEHSLLNAVGAWQQKTMYGRQYMGVVRSTFLLDPSGLLRFVWPKVKIKEHARQVLAKLEELAEHVKPLF